MVVTTGFLIAALPVNLAAIAATEKGASSGTDERAAMVAGVVFGPIAVRVVSLFMKAVDHYDRYSASLYEEAFAKTSAREVARGILMGEVDLVSGEATPEGLPDDPGRARHWPGIRAGPASDGQTPAAG